ncbi:alpha/beta fold hydrolase [Pseudomaricurvus alkylphenolicus]|uniref:alpha/beta fold hydrolase n=1 Tax=Pseudomaricurvus alkylphenolicus TaxID=1306991 RepID=UPI001421CE2D
MQSSVRCDFDVGKDLDLEGQQILATTVFEPVGPVKALLVCFPGGGCNRGWFDLRPKGDDSYSFGLHFCARGYRVVTVDHLGVGDSTKPDNGFDVAIETIVDANTNVVKQVLGRFGNNVPCIGVGHSMGAMLTILQQSVSASFDALALLGFSNCGIPHLLCDRARSFIGRAEQAREVLAEIADAQFGTGYVDLDLSGRETEGGRLSPPVAAALAQSRGRVLAMPAALSIIPGCVSAECRRLEMPLFLAAGDRDICDPLEAMRSQFPAAREVTCHLLEDAGHMHFIYPSRIQLFEAMLSWLDELVPVIKRQ